MARGAGGPATQAELINVTDARIGPDGFLYIADAGLSRILRVRLDGVIETFAGTGASEVSGDGGPAIEAGVRAPFSLAFATDGSLYFLDFRPAPQVRRIAPDGVISTVAGGRRSEFSGDGGPAVDAGLLGAFRMAVGSDGSIYLSVSSMHRIRKISPDGMIDTIAGVSNPYEMRGGNRGDGGPAIEAEVDRPRDIAVDSRGVVVFIDQGSSVIRRILEDGTIETVPNSTHFGSQGVEIDEQDRLYRSTNDGIDRMSDLGEFEPVWRNGPGDSSRIFSLNAGGRVLRVSRGQVREVVAEDQDAVVAGVSLDEATRGDGGSPTDATLFTLEGLAVSPDGTVYLAESGQLWAVRDGVIGRVQTTGDEITGVVDMTAGPGGDLFVTSRSPPRVWRVTPDGTVSRFAGGGQPPGLCVPTQEPCGDGGLAADAVLARPTRTAVDGRGVAYILESGRVRAVDADGFLSTVAIPAQPRPNVASIAVDRNDNLVASGRPVGRATYWRVAPDGQLGTIESLRGFAGTAGELGFDSEGNLYLSDIRENVRRFTPSGRLSTIVPSFLDRTRAPLEGMARGEELPNLTIRDFATSPSGDLYLASGALVYRINRPGACANVERPQIAVQGIRNGASFGASRVAPGTLISIFGRRLGPSQGLGARIVEGRLTSELGGVRVLIDGVPAAMTFTSEGQINAVVPHGAFAGGQVQVLNNGSVRFVPERLQELILEVAGALSEPMGIALQPADPALFTIDRFAAALNEDGTLNSSSNPAPPGSIVLLFGTGMGRTEPPSVDGEITGTTLPFVVEPVEVTFAREPAEVLYAGAAPGLVSGVIQINARISPDQRRRGAVRVGLEVGPFSSLQGAMLVVGE